MVLTAFWKRAGQQNRPSAMVDQTNDTDWAERLSALDADPYLHLADRKLRLISVFDDLKYDRADLDMMSGPMRRRLLEVVQPLGFRQVSGNVVTSAGGKVRLLFPKFRALGASPFDATRDTPRGQLDYYVLTPTQCACLMVDRYATEDGVERIKSLIVRHPINLFRLMDYLERSDAHRSFAGAIGHLRFVQRKAIESEPLRRRRALR